MKELTIWERLARAVRDQSFIVGSILVVIFVLAAVLGPELAPHNPFLRDRVQTIDGELQIAPFPPNGLYPLGTDDQGRDMLSLLLHGARQTLVIAFVAMVVRMLLGLLLGAISGWWPGRLFDRGVMAVTEFLAAIPALILVVLLVYAVGIQRGQVAFIVAVSLVGWGEIAQIVRGHVITIRSKLYVLASQAVGLGPAEILSRHVLPNLLSTLLALAALEMGAVLLLQGELGFLHVFIGGGGTYTSDAVAMGQVTHYFEIPDWGAMLGTSWGYFRSLPWLPLAPALAFFVSILGFNLFGYGLQRFVEKGRFHPSGWSVLRFFAVVALMLLGSRALLASSSLGAQLADMAEGFDVQRAWNDIAYLSHPDLEGRPSGPGGGYTAASYIAQQYQDLGLTPMPAGGYFQTFDLYRAQLTLSPIISVSPTLGMEGYDLGFGTDFFFDPWWAYEADSDRGAELLVLANAPDIFHPEGRPSRTAVLLLNPEEHPPGQGYAGETRYAALLRPIEDGWLTGPNEPPPPALNISFGQNTHAYPSLFVNESVVREMLAGVGLDLDELRVRMEAGEAIEEYTGLQLRVAAGCVYEETTGVNVIGYFPAADTSTQGDRIMVVAPYTGPRPSSDGEYYPGADEDASSVALMLEVARLWRDLGFEPKRTVVLVALDIAGGDRFLVSHPSLPTDSGDTWTAVILHGLAAGGPSLQRFESDIGLARTFDDSARRFRVDTEEMEEYVFFFQRSSGVWTSEHPGYTGLIVTRAGDDLSGTTDDTLEHLDAQALLETGQTLAHYLMVLSNR